MIKAALITGGAGFVGSHCADRLIAKGYRVIALDNFFTGKRENVSHLLESTQFVLISGDVTDVGFLTEVLRKEPITHVIHLAGIHFIPYCRAHPEETQRVNVEGTRTVLKAVDSVPVASFVLASSAAVYAPAETPHAETSPLGPLKVYGESKVEAEALVLDAASRLPGTAFVVARLFNVYGPRETNPHVIPEVITQLRHSVPIRVGNLWPQRDYVYVEDVAEALTRLLEWDGPALVVNIGTGQASSVADLLKTLERLLRREIPVEQDPERVRRWERARLVADCRRARAILAWEARHDLSAGLRHLLEAEGVLGRAAAQERMER